MLKLVLIVAVARNGVIGVDGQLPWRLPSELQRFRAATWGKPMIMGRKTFESIGKALPGRRTIVVTRTADFTAPDIFVAHSIDQALELAQAQARAMAAAEVMVVGGAEIYAAFEAQADRILLTEVDMEPQGDARFPALDAARWQEIAREKPERGPKDQADYIVKILERV